MSKAVATAAPRGWKPLLICPDPHIEEEVRGSLEKLGYPGLDLNAYPPHNSVAGLLATHRPNICFLDVVTNPDTALPLIQVLAQNDPSLAIVTLHANNDSELILRCLRQGAREFLFQPLTVDQLAPAIERLTRNRDFGPATQRLLGKLYAFIPGKRACGSTTVACNLAFHLKRLTQQKVLLADLDPLTGTIGFLLKLQSRYSFVDALTNSTRMDDDLWKALVTPCHGVDVLLAPEDPTEIPFEADMGALVDYWREAYGSIIMDSPGLYQHWGLQLAKLCDELMMVTTNELPALHVTQKALAHLEQNGVHSTKIQLIVNRYNPHLGLDQQGIEKALQHTISHLFPSDYKSVQSALMQAKPVPSGTKVGTSMLAMAVQFAGLEKAPRSPKKASLLSGFFSLFDGATS